jgi:hypothetical protein
MIASHNGKTSKGQNASFTLASVSVGRPVGVPKPVFHPVKVLIVSSAHLKGRTALTDEGLLLGKMVFGSVTPRPARCSASVSVRLRVVFVKMYCVQPVQPILGLRPIGLVYCNPSLLGYIMKVTPPY